MTWAISSNNLFATQSAALYALKAHLVANGWTVPRSSDGSTVSSSDLWASAANVNNLAWVRLQAPDGVREFVAQYRSATGECRFVYSASAKFTATAGTATTIPTATDDEFMNDTGTPNLVVPAAADIEKTICHIWAGNAAEDYAWAFLFFERTTGRALAGVGFDTLTDCSTADQEKAVAWRIHASSPDPWGLHANTNWWRSVGSTAPQTGVGTGAWAHYRKNLSGALYRSHGMCFWGGLNSFGPTMQSYQDTGSPAPYGDEQGLPAYWGRLQQEADARGIKGASRFFRLHGGASNVANTLVRSGVLLGNKTRVRYGCVSLPWNGQQVVV